MTILIFKSKVPKGLSYVFKSSIITEALEPLGFDLNLQLNFGISKVGAHGNRVFDCLHLLPNPNVGYDRFYSHIGTVNFEDKKVISDLLTNKVVPQFVEWVKFIKSLPENSTLLKKDDHFTVTYLNNDLKIEFEPSYLPAT